MNQQTSGLKRSNSESSSVSVNSELLLHNKKQKIDQLIKNTDSIDLNEQQSNNNNKTQKSAAETTAAAASKVNESSNVANTAEQQALSAAPTVVGSALPEGFFDDPDLDAQIRGQSREANLEAEYEEFKKIIQTEEFNLITSFEILFFENELSNNGVFVNATNNTQTQNSTGVVTDNLVLTQKVSEQQLETIINNGTTVVIKQNIRKLTRLLQSWLL
jgi:hypothetical protein